MKEHHSTFEFAGRCFELTSQMLMQRHVQADIVVYIWTSTTSIPDTNLQLIEESLMSLRKPMSSTSPSSMRAALFQCWYQIHSKRCASQDEGSFDLELLTETAMRMRSTFATNYLEAVENALMNEPIHKTIGVCKAITSEPSE